MTELELVDMAKELYAVGYTEDDGTEIKNEYDLTNEEIKRVVVELKYWHHPFQYVKGKMYSRDWCEFWDKYASYSYGLDYIHEFDNVLKVKCIDEYRFIVSIDNNSGGYDEEIFKTFTEAANYLLEHRYHLTKREKKNKNESISIVSKLDIDYNMMDEDDVGTEREWCWTNSYWTLLNATELEHLAEQYR